MQDSNYVKYTKRINNDYSSGEVLLLGFVWDWAKSENKNRLLQNSGLRQGCMYYYSCDGVICIPKTFACSGIICL